MNNSKLWVYGCSFSEPFNLIPKCRFYPDGSRDLMGVDYWGTYLGTLLNLECKTRSISGVGWNYITENIDADINKWGVDDIIIISPSFFSRATLLELEVHDLQGHPEKYANIEFKEPTYIAKHNETRWKNKIDLLQKFNYNIYTWVVATPEFVELPANLITPADGLIDWKDWMDMHYEYWCSLPGVEYELGDWHFNDVGHRAVAHRMYDVISNTGNINDN